MNPSLIRLLPLRRSPRKNMDCTLGSSPLRPLDRRVFLPLTHPPAAFLRWTTRTVRCLFLAGCLLRVAGTAMGQEQLMGTLTPLEGFGYGAEVAVSGDFAFVANRLKCQDMGTDFRRVDILIRNPVVGEWTRWKSLEAPPGRFRYFGWSVAMDGDFAVVGAPDFLNPDAEGADAGSGAAFVYARNQGGANNWGMVRPLTGYGPTFGTRVSLSANVLAVGEPRYLDQGRIHIHARNEGGADLWGRVKSLVPNLVLEGLSKRNAERPFGSVFDLSAGRLAIGSYDDDDEGPSVNSVEIRQANIGGVGNWGIERTIPAPAGAIRFGWSVALEGNRLAAAYARVAGEGAVGLYSGALFSPYTTFAVAGAEVTGPVAMGDDMLAVRTMEPDGRGLISAIRWPEISGLSIRATRVAGYGRTRLSEGIAVTADSLLFGLDAVASQAAATGAGSVRAMERTAGGADAWGMWPTTLPGLPGGGGFGKAMAMKRTSLGDLLVVGNPDFAAGGSARGLVTVFLRKGDRWELASRLSPLPGSSPGPMDGARFGEAVALDSLGNILVGAPGENADDGAAYRFEPAPRSPGYQHEGLVYDPPARFTPSGAGVGGRVGASVAIDTWVMLIGEPEGALGAGRVSYWVRTVGGGWGFNLVARTDADGNSANDSYGTAMALDGLSLVITAMTDENNGAAYAFAFNGTTRIWEQQQKIVPTDTMTGLFGKSVALKDDRLVIGVFPFALFLVGPGNAFYFNRSGSTWTQKAFLRTPGLENGDAHGFAAAIGKDYMLAGVPGDDGAGNTSLNAGSVFLYNTYGGPAASSFLREIRPAVAGEASGTALAADGLHFAVSAPSSDLIGTDAGLVRCYRLGSYERWAAGFAMPADGAGPDGDPDLDRRNNLEEFAMGTHPMAGGDAGYLEFYIAPDAGADYLFATWRRPLLYLTEDLHASWEGSNRPSTLSSAEVVTAVDLGALLTGRLRRSTSEWPRGLMRLRFRYPYP